MSLPFLKSSTMTSSGMCDALQISYNIFSPQDTIRAWKNVSELHLWQITSLDRSMKEHEILRQPPSEWACLWALNDILVPVTAFLLGNEVSLAVPITWFISQVSWSRAGKRGWWWGADICRIGPVCWMLGCWSSCSGGKKMISQEFSYHHYSISTWIMYYFLCFFAIQENLFFSGVVLWHYCTFLLFIV